MKKTRRVLLIAVALLACAALGLSALSEGTLSTLFTSASKLAFDTGNVTLNATAKFSYDGAWFKTFTGEYAQDGGRSYMRVMMDTPKEDGSVYTGGYTVVGEGTRAYAVDTYNGGYYTEAGTGYSETLLRSSSSTQALVDFGKLFLDMAEGAMGSGIVTEDTAEGRTYTVKLQAGDTPAVLNSAITLLAQSVARQRFGVESPADRSVGSYCLVEYEDWNKLFASMYKQQTGEELPEDYFDRLWSDDQAESKKLYAVYTKVCNKIDEITSEQYAQYHSGVSYILIDGSVQRFESYEAYVVAAGLQYTLYDNADKTFQLYYKKATGQELTDDMLTAIQYSTNQDLWDAYYELWTAMDEEYIAIAKADGKAICVTVHEDGTYSLINDVDDTTDYSGATVKYQILYAMSALTLDQADCVITLDQDGRITAGKGTVTFGVIDVQGESHPLEIVFDATAGAYGTSTVKDFDPADYGVTDFDTFWQKKQAEDAASVNELDDYEGDMESSGQLDTLPQSITFNGKEYDTAISDFNADW